MVKCEGGWVADSQGDVQFIAQVQYQEVKNRFSGGNGAEWGRIQTRPKEVGGNEGGAQCYSLL